MLNFPCTQCTTPSLEAHELEDLLNYLKRVEQVDLTGYKRATILRRTQIRMQRVGIEHYQDYLDHLKQQPDEVILNPVMLNYFKLEENNPKKSDAKTSVFSQPP